MSTAKEIFLKVKALFAEPVTAGPTDIQPEGEVYKLVDGTEVTITQAGENPAVADTVTISGSPAPAGDYTLEDGTTFSTDETGTITIVTMPSAEPVIDPATLAAPVAPATPTKTVEERLAAIEEELAKIKMAATPAPVTGMATAEQMATAEATIEKYGKVIEGQFELLEQLMEAPTTKPATQTVAKKEVSDKQQKREDKFKAMADAFAASKTTNRNPVTV